MSRLLLKVPALVFYIVIVILLAFVVYFLEKFLGNLLGFYSNIAKVLVYSCGAIILWQWKKKDRDNFLHDWGMYPARQMLYFLGGIFLFAFSAFLARLMTLGFVAISSIQTTGLAVIFLSGFLGAFGEEVLFRGYLFGKTKNVCRSVLFALLFSSLVFGFLHSGSPFESKFYGCVVASFAGSVFALAYLISGSIWLPIGFHAAWNSCLDLILTPDLAKLVTSNVSVLAIAFIILIGFLALRGIKKESRY